MNLKCTAVPLADLPPDLDASIRCPEVLGRDENSEGNREGQHQSRELQPSHLYPQKKYGRRMGPGVTICIQQPSSGPLGIVHMVTVEFCA